MESSGPSVRSEERPPGLHKDFGHWYPSCSGKKSAPAQIDAYGIRCEGKVLKIIHIRCGAQNCPFRLRCCRTMPERFSYPFGKAFPDNRSENVSSPSCLPLAGQNHGDQLIPCVGPSGKLFLHREYHGGSPTSDQIGIDNPPANRIAHCCSGLLFLSQLFPDGPLQVLHYLQNL